MGLLSSIFGNLWPPTGETVDVTIYPITTLVYLGCWEPPAEKLPKSSNIGAFSNFETILGPPI